MGDVVSLNLPHAQSRLLEQDYDFTRGVDEALGCVATTLRALEHRDDSRNHLHALSTDLLDLLSYVERDHLLDMAVDHLLGTARRLLVARQQEGDPPPEAYHELGSAYLVLRSRVVLARPRGTTRQTG